MLTIIILIKTFLFLNHLVIGNIEDKLNYTNIILYNDFFEFHSSFKNYIIRANMKLLLFK